LLSSFDDKSLLVLVAAGKRQLFAAKRRKEKFPASAEISELRAHV